jgi:ribosomal protein S18 acetylase RimI-like enzyme
MSISIRAVAREDLPEILLLMSEFARDEGLEQYLEVDEGKLSAAMFSGTAFVDGLIAVDGRSAVGYAIFYPHFSSFRGQRGLYLEDIFVTREYRGRGVGRQLLAEVTRRAAENGFERLDLLVNADNENAIRFYENLGAERNENERHFRFVDAAFQKLLS